jgi:hypothetical protein
VFLERTEFVWVFIEMDVVFDCIGIFGIANDDHGFDLNCFLLLRDWFHDFSIFRNLLYGLKKILRSRCV